MHANTPMIPKSNLASAPKKKIPDELVNCLSSQFILVVGGGAAFAP